MCACVCVCVCVWARACVCVCVRALVIARVLARAWCAACVHRRLCACGVLARARVKGRGWARQRVSTRIDACLRASTRSRTHHSRALLGHGSARPRQTKSHQLETETAWPIPCGEGAAPSSRDYHHHHHTTTPPPRRATAAWVDPGPDTGCVCGGGALRVSRVAAGRSARVGSRGERDGAREWGAGARGTERESGEQGREGQALSRR